MKNVKIKKHFLLLIVVGIFLISGCQQSAGNSLTESSLIDIGNDKFTQLLKAEAGVFIYIGRPTCSVCQELEPILEETLRDLGKELYYYNTDEARQEDEQQMIELLDSLEILSVPTLIYVENGQVIEQLNGLQSAEDLILFFTE